MWVWGTVAVVVIAGNRGDVVAMAADVGRFEVIDRGDLTVVQVGAGSGLDVVAGGEVEELVGRVAAVDLVGGSLLAPAQVLEEGEPIVSATEALVGARLKPAEVPSDGVRAGAAVQVVVRPAPGAAGTAATSGAGGGGVAEFEAWLLSIGDPDEATGERSVSLVVPRQVAGNVTAAAADGRVSVVVLEG
jgi:hypothetical protein